MTFFAPKAIAIAALGRRLAKRGQSIAVQVMWMQAAAEGRVDMRTMLLQDPNRTNFHGSDR